jgi:hypothetical protein
MPNEQTTSSEADPSCGGVAGSEPSKESSDVPVSNPGLPRFARGSSGSSSLKACRLTFGMCALEPWGG